MLRYQLHFPFWLDCENGDDVGGTGNDVGGGGDTTHMNEQPGEVIADCVIISLEFMISLL